MEIMEEAGMGTVTLAVKCVRPGRPDPRVPSVRSAYKDRVDIRAIREPPARPAIRRRKSARLDRLVRPVETAIRDFRDPLVRIC